MLNDDNVVVCYSWSEEMGHVEEAVVHSQLTLEKKLVVCVAYIWQSGLEYAWCKKNFGLSNNGLFLLESIYSRNGLDDITAV